MMRREILSSSEGRSETVGCLFKGGALLEREKTDGGKEKATNTQERHAKHCDS